MYCANCGGELDSGAKFCTNCGAPVSSKLAEKNASAYNRNDASDGEGSFNEEEGIAVSPEETSFNDDFCDSDERSCLSSQNDKALEGGASDSPEDAEEYSDDNWDSEEDGSVREGELLEALEFDDGEDGSETDGSFLAKEEFSKALASLKKGAGSLASTASSDFAQEHAEQIEQIRKNWKLIAIVLGVALLLLFGGFACTAVFCSGGDSKEEASVTAPAPKTYQLDMNFHCQANIMFSCYDVEVFVDGESVGVVEHGEDASLHAKLEAGEHTLEVKESGTDSVKGSKTFTMPAEKAVMSCDFACFSGKIEIKDYAFKTAKEAEDESKAAEEQAKAEEAAQKEAEEKAAAEQAELEKTGAKVPGSPYDFTAEYYTEVKAAFESAGFANVVATCLYDLDSPDTLFADNGDVDDVTINGEGFDEGEYFPKDAAVEITYHWYKYDDPSVTYNYYTVDGLKAELEANPIRAKDAHEGELVQLDGCIVDFDSKGRYIDLGTSPDDWDVFGYVTCYTVSDDQKSLLANYSVGDYVSIQGEITKVDGAVSSYQMDIHRIL